MPAVPRGSIRGGSSVRGRKKGPTKEEQEKMAKEAEEKLIKDELFAREREAEAFQRKHDAERDEYESTAAFRIQREGELRELTDSKALINTMNLKMSTLTEEIEKEREETEKELHRLRHLVEKGNNDLASTKKEQCQTEMHLRDDRERLIEQNCSLETQIIKARAQIDSLSKDLARLETVSEKESADLRSELAAARERYQRETYELGLKNRNLERQSEKLKELNDSLQDVLKQREADDKRNTNLLELMNQQLDESKKRQQEFLEDERRRTREISAELEILKAKFVNMQEENNLLKLENESVKRDSTSFTETIKSSTQTTEEWKAQAKSEMEEVKKNLQSRLEETLQKTVTLSEELISLRTKQESSKQQIAELQTLLKKKEHQTNDRVAFLNAQIASERAIIRELLEKIGQQEDSYNEMVANYEDQLQQRQFSVADMSNSLIRQMEQGNKEREHELRIRQANDAHFRGRIQDLETELKRKDVLRIASNAGETELEIAMKEIRRLEELLDDHHIVHRHSQFKGGKNNNNNSSSSVAPRPPSRDALNASQNKNNINKNNNNMSSSQNINNSNNQSSSPASAELQSENKSLTVKLEKAMKDQEIQKRISLEVETRLNSQVKNLYEVIDALHGELAEAKKEYLDRIYVLEKEKEQRQQKDAEMRRRQEEELEDVDEMKKMRISQQQQEEEKVDEPQEQSPPAPQEQQPMEQPREQQQQQQQPVPVVVPQKQEPQQQQQSSQFSPQSMRRPPLGVTPRSRKQFANSVSKAPVPQQPASKPDSATSGGSEFEL